MITYATTTHKPALKALWEICFEDSEKFINFYFDCIYQNENSLIFLDEKNIPIAFLQIIPYQLKLGKTVYNAGYISGAMTHPEHRKKGYMRQLMNVAFSEMKKLNYTFTFLIPQEERLFDFYTKLGYEKAFPKSTIEIDQAIDNEVNSRNVEIFDELNKIPIEKLYSLYSLFLNGKTNAILKTQEQFIYFLEDLFSDEGCAFCIEDSAFAFAVPSSNRTIIKEFFCIQESVKYSLLRVVQKTFKQNKLLLPNVFGQSCQEQLYGMIKVLIPSNIPSKIDEDIYMGMMLD